MPPFVFLVAPTAAMGLYVGWLWYKYRSRRLLRIVTPPLVALALISMAAGILSERDQKMTAEFVAAQAEAGKDAMKRLDYDRAIGHFERARLGCNDPAEFLGLLAECYRAKKDYKTALRLCDELNRLRPQAGRAHYIRGLVYMDQKDKRANVELAWAVRYGERDAATLLPKDFVP